MAESGLFIFAQVGIGPDRQAIRSGSFHSRCGGTTRRGHDPFRGERIETARGRPGYEQRVPRLESAGSDEQAISLELFLRHGSALHADESNCAHAGPERSVVANVPRPVGVSSAVISHVRRLVNDIGHAKQRLVYAARTKSRRPDGMGHHVHLRKGVPILVQPPVRVVTAYGHPIN